MAFQDWKTEEFKKVEKAKDNENKGDGAEDTAEA